MLDDAKRDGHGVADFYNTVSNLEDTSRGIKLQFPLGGYWQQMRAATTATYMRQLQKIVTYLGKEVTDGVPTEQVGRTCQQWAQLAEGGNMHADTTISSLW